MATIVLIDADANGRRLAELTLKQDGHEVFSFRDGRSVKAAADSLPTPQLIVGALDDATWPTQLPKAGGWQAVPLLILAPADAARPAVPGTRQVAVLETPYPLADLRARVRQLL